MFFNTIVIPSFSHGVRQCIQNPPARYFLNSENVLGKFSCKNPRLQQNRGFALSLRVSRIPAAQQRGGKGGEREKSKLAWGRGLRVWALFNNAPVSSHARSAARPRALRSRALYTCARRSAKRCINSVSADRPAGTNTRAIGKAVCQLTLSRSCRRAWAVYLFFKE